MFKKICTVLALIGVGVMGQTSMAAAHPSEKYHTHKKQGYQKPYVKKHAKKWKHGKEHRYGNKHRYGQKHFYGNRLAKIRRKLRNRGFYNIRFTDRHLPVYKAVACKRNKRMKLVMNRWGHTMWRTRIGWCR